MHTFLIASANERLYFSGIPDHGSKTQKLVGTILIGHVPLPVVHKDGRDFLSMYPYTDFFWSSFFSGIGETNRYEYIGAKPDKPEPDIWHSVIDPNSGSLDQDVQKIRDFLLVSMSMMLKRTLCWCWKKNHRFSIWIQYKNHAISKWLLGVYENSEFLSGEYSLSSFYTRVCWVFYDTYLSLMKSDGTADVVPFSQWKNRQHLLLTFCSTPLISRPKFSPMNSSYHS